MKENEGVYEKLDIDGIDARIEIAKQTQHTTNCFGTAFYFSGVTEKDGLLLTPNEYVSKLSKLDKPEIGCLVIFAFSEDPRGAYHIGIVTGIEPLLITHRL